MAEPLVAVLMGSKSDWDTMSHTTATLDELDVPHDVRVLSAHRTPDALAEYVDAAVESGVCVFIAGAGMAAHLAGAVAARTTRPVLGVPMPGPTLNGLDALLSTVQMPPGVPVPTLAIGKAGAINAAITAAAILGLRDQKFADAVTAHRRKQGEKLLANADPR